MNGRSQALWAIGVTLIAGCAQRVCLAETLAATNRSPVRTYAVGKKVADFPLIEDLSTPEAAYVTINRAKIAEGPAAGARLSIAEIAARFARAPKVPMPPEQAGPLREAQILEVQIVHETNAAVFARIRSPKGERVEYQSLQKEYGRWLNRGNDGASTLAEARNRYAASLAYREAQGRLSSRPPIANPEEHLKPFVEFLKREATDPGVFLLQALASHAVVVLGEVHNRPRYWAFNTALVRAPAFARETGVIYLEFPVNDQPLLDRFLAAPTNDPAPVVEMLRDMFEMGWPDQPTVEFCQAVWEVNQTLPPPQRLRLVLVDMARPWKEIQKREDWRKHEVDRDAFMAENILRDLREHGDDPRHALFIVGWMHATKNLTRPGGEPMESAGQRLQGALGASKVLTVFPHCPVMANRGEVNGRLALGLFESAFAALTNRPMAFPLDRGPFGELPFDASMDFVTSDPYRAAFDAFLYLGPLEDEIMSPLVPGFYTDEYAREVDRRCRLMNGKGLPKADGGSLVALRSQWWGQPRRTWQALGPLNAWEHGSDWEKKLTDAKHQNPLNDAAATTDTADDLDAKIAQLSKKGTTVEEVLRVLGEPESYQWGDKIFAATNLPATYLLVYPKGVSVGIMSGRVWELRSEKPGPGFTWGGKLRLGSSLEDVLAVLGPPAETVTGEALAYKPGVLYKDWNGKRGYCYYSRPEQNIRLFFGDYKVTALYVPLEEDGSGGGDGEQFMQVTAISEVKEYQDVRFKDLSKLKLAGRPALPPTLTFNQKTIWPTEMPPGAEPARLLADAMNPGLGVRKLHQEGLTGKGVNVAIIDQPLYQDHPEFAGKIAAYQDVGCGSESSMHGPAVASLLVGAKCGTAPDARLYFVAAPSWTGDSAYQAKALDWITDQNEKLLAGEKIRVVSVSAAPSGPGSPFKKSKEMWDTACARAEKAGILVLDCTSHHGFLGPCYYDATDPETVSRCRPGFPSRPGMPIRTDRLLVPCSPRTVAEEYERGDCAYQYCGQGGLSWGIPYAAGVLALGWQARPELTGPQLRELLFASAHVTPEGAKIINPSEFIRLVKAHRL